MIIETKLRPEEELRTKQAEQDDILDWLAQNRMELEPLHAEVDSISSTYNAAVLPKVAKAKGLRTRIAQAKYVLVPTDTIKQESQKARSSADEAVRGSPGDIVRITVSAEPEDRTDLR
jgi:hypothetical protein